MQRCLQLAFLGTGQVAPNPMVGAALVHEGRIIGEGFHEQCGQAHAEVNAVQDAIRKGNGELIRNSTLYVSLEPCAHHGKTPPCTDLIIAHHIPSVVIGCPDPFHQVNGKGISLLQQAGTQVIVGVMENECLELNRRFFTFHQKQRPYVILKWAETGNGMIGYATGSRLHITNEITNRLVHKWRSEEAAIMVGTNTALMDDPQLTNRHWYGHSPHRLVLDLNLRLPKSLRLFDGSTQTLVFNNVKNEEPDDHRSFIKVDSGNDLLQQIMHSLHSRSIQSVLIEGGATLLRSFIDEGLWDEARILKNENLMIETGIPAPSLGKALLIKNDVSGSDRIGIYRNMS